MSEWPAERAGGVGDRREEPLRRAEMIVLVGLDGLARLRFAIEVEAVAERIEQPLLEHAQRALERRTVAQAVDRLVVVIEQRRQRIVPRRQFHQQLVQIERGHQAGSGHWRRGLRAFGPGELRRLTPAGPGQQQHLKRLQDGGELRLRAANAAGKQGQPAVIAGHHLEDTARIAVRPVVEDVGRCEVGCGGRCVSFEAEILQGAGIVGPILAHFHPECQVQPAAEQAHSERFGPNGRRASSARPWRRSQWASALPCRPRWRRRP